jgi:endonuclease YncB( thermonuclease family)
VRLLGRCTSRCARRGQRNTADKTCVADGDTLWLHGENIRLRDFDTPEPQTNICGGEAEVALAAAASARLLELLNGNDWMIEATATSAAAALIGVWLPSGSMAATSATS